MRRVYPRRVLPATAAEARRSPRQAAPPGRDGQARALPGRLARRLAARALPGGERQLEILVRPLASGAARAADEGRQDRTSSRRWSPDGKRSPSTRRDRAGIWVISAEGGTPRPLADFGSRPAWSPDGRRIAFQSARSPTSPPPGVRHRSVDDLDRPGTGGPRPARHDGRQAQGRPRRAGVDAGRPPALLRDVRAAAPLRRDLVGDARRLGAEEGLRRARDSTTPSSRPDSDALVVSGRAETGCAPSAARPRSDGAPRARPSAIARPAPDVPRTRASRRTGGMLAWSDHLDRRPAPLPPARPRHRPPVRAARASHHRRGALHLAGVSPDGQTVAFGRVPPGGSNDVWLMGADGEPPSPVASGPSIDYALRLLPRRPPPPRLLRPPGEEVPLLRRRREERHAGAAARRRLRRGSAAALARRHADRLPLQACEASRSTSGPPTCARAGRSS